jgi:exonuclease SbcC
VDLEHPNVMQAEDVSEQLATIEDYFKISKSKKEIAEIALKAEKLEFSTHMLPNIKTGFT